MEYLSAETRLALWERGRDQHALDRALTILQAATPGATRGALADLTIGERDARLLELRALLFGPHAEGFAECPQCGEHIEFPLDTGTFRPQPEGRASAHPADGLAYHEIVSNGDTVRFRLPTSRDLADVVVSPDSSEALRRLVERCLLPPDDAPSSCHPEPRRRRGTSHVVADHTSHGSDALAPGRTNSDSDPPIPDARSFGALRQPQDDKAGELSEEVVAALSRAMLEADPNAEIRLDLICPVCAHRWELLFDVADFFWGELAAQAQRFLGEIDALARAYGWTEHEILNLSPARRQTYLELVTG